MRWGGGRAAHAEHCPMGTESAGLHGAPEGASALARGLLQADTPDVHGKLLQDPGPPVRQSSLQGVLSTDPLSETTVAETHTCRGTVQSCRSCFSEGPTMGLLTGKRLFSALLISHT